MRKFSFAVQGSHDGVDMFTSTSNVTRSHV